MPNSHTELSRIRQAPSKGLGEQRRDTFPEGCGPERPAEVAGAPLRLSDRPIKRRFNGIRRKPQPPPAAPPSQATSIAAELDQRRRVGEVLSGDIGR
jgi:hypothetical protein